MTLKVAMVERYLELFQKLRNNQQLRQSLRSFKLMSQGDMNPQIGLTDGMIIITTLLQTLVLVQMPRNCWFHPRFFCWHVFAIFLPFFLCNFSHCLFLVFGQGLRTSQVSAITKPLLKLPTWFLDQWWWSSTTWIQKKQQGSWRSGADTFLGWTCSTCVYLSRIFFEIRLQVFFGFLSLHWHKVAKNQRKLLAANLELQTFTKLQLEIKIFFAGKEAAADRPIFAAHWK